MPSDYDKIRADNIIEYGQGTRHLSLLGRLYTDGTHFIFELLQNAEDAGASRVLFQLLDDKLEVFHDGRFFDEKDVRGICGVGEGTKAEDLTQIGKFGIGFKSVYAYTTTPEIYSGNEHFRIENYVRPYGVQQRDIGDSWTTLFVFPFNKEEVEPATACREITTRLRKLNARTLLFLRKIKEIEYKLPDGMSGVYLRDETARGSAQEVTVIGQNNGEDESESWLLFERPVDVPEPVEECPRQVSVEIGFRLQRNEGEELEEVTRIKDSPLVVFFPTEKETRLGFLIQGPYKTTPSRDNIPKEDDWNATLVRETACLIADVLPQLKDLGLLGVSLLEALPIRLDDFPEDGMFYPIFTAVRTALETKKLLPADDGSFVSAQQAKLASAEWLRKLLRQDQLNLLFQKEVKWIYADITERGRHEVWKYLREELKIDEVTPDGFARKLDHAFLNDQSDQWMIEFYAQLPNQKALWKKGSGNYWDADGPLRKKPFIRLQDGSHVRPFDDDDKPNAYLPAKTPVDSQLPTVKAEIAYHDEVRRFLVSDLKIPEFDIVAEVIEHVLPKYTSPNPPKKEEHLRDIEKIVEAFQTDSQEKQKRLKDALKETPFILSRSSRSDGEIYRRPDALYFQNDSLEMYFSGNSNVGFIASIYEDKEAISKMFNSLGVRDKVRVEKRKPDHKGCVQLRDYHGCHERGLNGFDPDIEVEGLSIALSSPTPEKSLFIWNKIVCPNAECIRGTIEKSSRQTYENSSKEERISESFGRLLIESKWLPGAHDQFYRPGEIILDELPEQFERSEKLADLLGMKKDIVAKLAEEAGVNQETIELARELERNPDILKSVQEQIKRKKGIDFPNQKVVDPERRKNKIIEELQVSSDKQYEPRTRSVRVSEATQNARTSLQNRYTNENKQMVCQICKKEMPFKKLDGEYYFEAVEAFTKDIFPKEHEAQFLALCPLCAAMYKELSKKDEAVMADLRKALLNMDSLEAPLRLGDLETTIQFVETHLCDIKTILEEIGRSED
ncbi:MAG: hypothetical protein GX457_14260 [Thermotogaceae bacterium]|nr:hypothetical protein [Thermotogaceae bacterium]